MPSVGIVVGLARAPIKRPGWLTGKGTLSACTLWRDAIIHNNHCLRVGQSIMVAHKDLQLSFGQDADTGHVLVVVT